MIADFDRRATRGRCEEKWQSSPDRSSREYYLAKYNGRGKRFLRVPSVRERLSVFVDGVCLLL